MSTPIHELPRPQFPNVEHTRRSSDEEGTYVGDDMAQDGQRLKASTTADQQRMLEDTMSPSGAREQKSRLQDDLELLRAEQEVTNAEAAKDENDLSRAKSFARTRSRRSEPQDEFDIATNPLHEKTNVYKPPEHPTTNAARLFKKVHGSSFLIRYFSYIMPLVLLILVPLLLGALVFKDASVGGVDLMWFSVWLMIVWLTLWAGRILAKCLPWPLGLVASLFTNNNKKWRDMGKQLEVPATLFFWWLAIEISFLPTMKNHHTNGNTATKPWESTLNKILLSIFAGMALNFAEKIIIQLIAISFHLRTYSDRIDINKFQIASLTKLYTFSKENIHMDDSEFEDQTPKAPSGTATPMQYLDKAQKNAKSAFSKVGDVAGKVAGDFTGKQVTTSSHPHQVILTLLSTTDGSQVLARRLYRTFAREETETVFQDDLKAAFESDEEADAAFQMFDKDLNGDVTMEELEAVCVEIGRERKSITASLKDLDSVVSKLDDVFLFIVIIITILIFLSVISSSTAGVLTSAGSTLLALSWLFSVTAQEFLQSIIFVFVKHPFDVGDRVSIYGNTGASGKGDDYFVKEIALLYTEFKKMEGQVVQAPNSYLNTLFILNMRRSGGLAEAVPVTIKFGTSLEQIDSLRQRLLDFVKVEKREYQGKILTELREVDEAHAITLNVVFFYKSNWQNELLRLQRRNKFICAMMVSMLELGIEGPRMRYPGQKESFPVYLQNLPVMQPAQQRHEDNHDTAPGAMGSATRDPSAGGAESGALGHHPSILRNGAGAGATNQTDRTRGESASAMSKRVDFSLGMSDISSGDMMSDLYDDRSRTRPFPTTQSRSRTRISEEANGKELGRTTSAQTASEVGRVSQDSQARLRSSHSTHRNRFFGRSKADDRFDERDLESGAMSVIPESGPSNGKMDPRTGIVSPQAVSRDPGMAGPSVSRQGTEPHGHFDSVRRSATDNFEMSKLRNKLTKR
ncbi:MAG: hypothetical protein M1817_002463 [Caeruleum heppii]|nr:MAG: hypothetical protein M1817_002463 [Caeruleum heppii]